MSDGENTLRRRTFLGVVGAAGAATTLGCGAEPKLTLNIPPPLSAAVGRDLELPLHAYAESQGVRWSWASLQNPMLAQRQRRPTLTEYTGGTAVWRWQLRYAEAGVDDFLKGVTDEAGFWKATLRGPAPR